MLHPLQCALITCFKTGILFAVYRKAARRTEEDVVPVQRPIIPHVL
jgi:hypothetical protein